MLANGISNIDTYSYQSLSGIVEEFRAGVREYYRPVMATDPIFTGHDVVLLRKVLATDAETIFWT